MADLGNLNFGVHLKNYTEQEYEAIKKKLVNMHATVSARVGLKTDVKEIEDKVEALLKNKTYKVKLEVDSESIKSFTEAFKGKGMTSDELRGIKGFATTVRMDADVTYKKVLQDIRREREQLDASIKKEREQLNASLKRGREQSEAVLRATQAASSIIRADAYANSQMKRTDAYVNSQKALEQLRNARMQAAKASDTHNAAMKRANSTMSSQSRIAGELKNQIANVYSIYTVERFVRGLYTIGGEFQKQRIALTSILGDSMKAETIFNRIKDLAVVSPFQFKELASYTKQLSAYSIPYEELYDTTKRLADISAGVGVDMGRIILAYGQVRSAAFLRGQELRQFTEAGIPLVDELAKRFTILENKVVSAGDVFDKISRKEVSFGMVKDVLWDLTNEGGKFYNMQEALAESLAGKWSNLQDAWDVMMADIAESNSGVLSDSLELLTDLMKHWEDFAKVIIPIITSFGTYKTVALLASSVNLKLIKTFISLTASVRSLKDAIALLGLVTKANPLGLLLGALSGIIALFYAFREEVKTTEEVITDLNKTIADTNDKMQGNKAVDSLIDRYEALSKKANKSAEESRELGRITKNLANTFKDAVTQTDKYGVAISLSVEKMRKLSQEQKDLYKKQFIGTMANAQIQKQSIDSERERLAGIIREGGYRRFDENGRELSFAKYKPEDITKARNRLLELEKQSLDLANIIDTARQSYHSMNQINISKPLTDWEKEANKLAGDMDALKPKEGTSYEEYMDMLSGNISDLEKKTKAFASGNKYSEKQLASYNKELETTRKIYKALGGLEKSSGSEKDPIAEQWKDRADLISKALSLYDKWKKIEGEEAASQRVKGVSEFAPIFNKNGVNLDLSDPSKAYQYIQDQLDQSKGKQMELYLSLGVKKENINYNNVKKGVDDALKEIERYISQAGEKWDLYKKLFEATGNKSLSMNIAFGEEVSFKSIVDDLRSQLYTALEDAGSKFSVTDVLAMKEDDVKKHFGEEAILKLYQSINEENKKMRSESLENLLGMMEDYKDYAQKIKDIERNLQKDLADIESQRGQLGEEAANILIEQRKKKASEDIASIEFEQFKQEINWELIFGDLDRVSKKLLEQVKQQLKELKNSNEYKNMAVDQKKVVDEALNNIQSTIIDKGGLLGNLPEQLDELRVAQEKLNEAQEEYNKSLQTGTKAEQEEALKKRNIAEQGVQNAQVNVIKSTDKTKQNLITLANTITQLGSSSEMSLSQIGGLASGLIDTLTEAGSKIGGIVGAVLSLLDAIDKQGFDKFVGNVFKGVFNALGSIQDTLTFGLFSKITKSGDSDENLERDIEYLTQSNEDLKNALDNLSEKMDKASVTDASDIYEVQRENILKQQANTLEAMQRSAAAYSNGFLGIGGSHSTNKKINEGMSASEWERVSDIVGVSVTNASQFFQLSSEQMAKLAEEDTSLYSKIKSLADDGYKNAAQYMDEYITYYKQLEELENTYNEKLTNTSFDNIRNDFKNALLDMESDAEDFANNFEKMMQNAIVESLMTKKYDKLIQEWYEMFAKAMESGGGIDKQEQADLQNKWDNIVNQALAERDALKEAMGWKDSSSSSGLSKGIQGVTEDTANLLGSYINGIRLDVSAKRVLLEKIGNDILPKYNVLAEAQLKQLNMIVENTKRMADSNDAILDEVSELRNEIHSAKSTKDKGFYFR